jgi:hypothetical protein
MLEIDANGSVVKIPPRIQIRKWIHGNPASLEIVFFRLSDNLITSWEL